MKRIAMYGWALAALLLPVAAQATLITNLDDEPHVLLINDGGELTKIMLEPNASIRRLSPRLLVQVEGTDGFVDIRDHDEYTIRHGGRLSLQKVGNIRKAVR